VILDLPSGEGRWVTSRETSASRPRFVAPMPQRPLEEGHRVLFLVTTELGFRLALLCRLKREPRAEIDLQEVVLGTVNDIPGGFGEHSEMGSKAILESPTKVAQHLVTEAQTSIRA
jgi:hypothetical protein